VKEYAAPRRAEGNENYVGLLELGRNENHEVKITRNRQLGFNFFNFSLLCQILGLNLNKPSIFLPILFIVRFEFELEFNFFLKIRQIWVELIRISFRFGEFRISRTKIGECSDLA
jgi:hypothetical protein